MYLPDLLVAILMPVLLLVVTIETVVLLRLKSHYNRILKGNHQGLTSLLEGTQKTLSAHESKLAKVAGDLSELRESGLAHLQNLVVRRFNPFSDTGGDQSFILGLLDGRKNGVVITSLHSRENTRFYIKSVVEGVGDPHPLSDDEKMIFKKG